jgi:formylglycine-generating enzyme required for sulfatase activity
VTWIKHALERGQQNKAKQYLAGLRTVKSQSPKSYKLPDNTAQMPVTAQPAQPAQSTNIVEQAPVSAPPTILPPQEETPSLPTSITTRDSLQKGSQIPEMVQIPAGRFRMGNTQGQGDDDEQPVHWVSIKRFAMSRYEVTFAQYDNFAQATGRKKPNDEGWGRGNQPVINVSQEDATAYAQWLTQQSGQKYRLPTEAEWEYAARAKTKTVRYWGNDPDQACDYANVWDKTSQKENPNWKWTAHNCADGYAHTAPVGRFKPNAFGLFDMLGNVWEWVCSEYEETYSGKEQSCVKGNNLDSLYIVRGGSWSVGPRLVRAALRGRDVPGNSSYHVGFRIVRQ